MVNASCVSEVERRIGWACARLLRHRRRIIGVAGRQYHKFSPPPENRVIQRRWTARDDGKKTRPPRDKKPGDRATKTRRPSLATRRPRDKKPATVAGRGFCCAALAD